MKNFCKKMVDVFKKPLWLLCLGLGIVLFASIFANMANTSLYSVSVTEVSFETEHGEMTGLLYKPKTCTAANPCATIVTTHGYLNSKEMQDAPAVELSKRGYVVLAMDMYDHGDSTWDTAENGGSFLFFRWSQYDAVQWAYEQDFVLKSDEGVGMIAVSGHSMGGFSSRVATYMDSAAMKRGEKQKIVAALPVGADFQYVGWGLGIAETLVYYMDPVFKTDANGELMLDSEGRKQYIVVESETNPTKYTMANHDYDATTPDVKVSAKLAFRVPTTAEVIQADADAQRTMGTIAGQYDEFFFYAGNGGTVREKDYTKTTEGISFYNGGLLPAQQVKEFESGEWNDDSYGGAGSVIYVPHEIHPWNHFSVETTSYMIDFYDRAFETQFEIHNVTENEGVVAYEDGNGQTWWLKEGFECIGLIGMFVSIIAAIALFASLPFFSKVTTAGEEINEVKEPTTTRKWLSRALLVASCFATAYVYPMMSSDGSLDAYVEGVKAVMWAAAIVTVALVVAGVVVRAVKGEDENTTKVISNAIAGGVAILAAGFFSYWTLTNQFFTNSNFYTEPGTNTIAYWVLVSSGLSIIALVAGHFLSNKKDGYTCANYGLKANWKQILIALLIAVIVVTGVYAITFAVEFLLRVDFRVWTYAIKPFSGNHFVAFLKYLPVFFLFFLVTGLNVVANTGKDRSWKGTLKAVLIAALPLVILVGVHYGYDFATGVAKWPNEALHMILVWVLPITMGFAAWIVRKSWQKTGNLWTGVFICALLFTLIQVANTTLYLM